MPTKQRRYPLKSKEAKQISSEASQRLGLDLEALFGQKGLVEVIDSDVGLVYLIDGRALLFRVGERLLPTLLFSEFVARAPRIVVDMGAVPFVCKGAAVMAPGIVRVEGEFGLGDLVLVVDVKHGKALALGESLMDAQTARDIKKGPVVRTLHFVGDKVWDFVKGLID